MLQRDAITKRMGTKSAGFSVAFVPGNAQLHLELWGYWNDETAAAFAREAVTAVRETSEPLELVLDAGAFKPQGAEGQDALRRLLQSLASVSMSRGVLLVENALTKMQLARILKESGVQSCLRFAESIDTGPRRAVC